MAAPQTDAARVLIIPEAFETISRNTHEAELRDLCIAVNDPNRYLNYRNPLPGQRSWESIHCLRINSARADGMQCAEHPSLFDPTLPAGRCTNIGSQAMLMNRDEDEYLIRHLAWPICDRCRQLADNVPMLVDAKEIPYSSYLVTWFPPAPPAAPVPVLGGRHLRNRVIHPPGPPPPPPPPLPPAAMATITPRDQDSELCDSNWTRLCVRHHNQFAAQPVPSGRFRGECECGPTYFRRWRNAANRDLHYMNMKTNFAQWAQGIRDDLRPMEYWRFNYYRGRQYRKWNGPPPQICGQCVMERYVEPHGSSDSGSSDGSDSSADTEGSSNTDSSDSMDADGSTDSSSSSGTSTTGTLSSAGLNDSSELDSSISSGFSSTDSDSEMSSDAGSWGSSNSLSSDGSASLGLVGILGNDVEDLVRLPLEPAGDWEPCTRFDDHWIHTIPERADQVKFCLSCVELVWL